MISFEELYQETMNMRSEWNKAWKSKGIYRHEPNTEDLGNVCGLGDIEGYRFFYNYILQNKPKLIVEYGPGVSTYFMQRVIEEAKLHTQIASFENDMSYFGQIKTARMDRHGSVRLVPLLLSHYLGRDNPMTMAEYIHDYDTLYECALLIIDGPHVNRHGATITSNLTKFVETFGFWPDVFFDDRVPTRKYYQKKKAAWIAENPKGRVGKFYYKGHDES